MPVFAADVICGGDSIGIALSYDGVLVTGTYTYSIDQQVIDPKTQDIQANDLITHVNQNKVDSIASLASTIQLALEKQEDIVLTLKRNNESIERSLNVHYDQATDTFKTGLYVKDSTIGIGTMTYYDPQNHTFASLGHALNDQYYELQFSKGYLYSSYVNDVRKNTEKSTGEKIAVVDKDEIIGKVVYNNEIGVYGYYYGTIDGQMIETASIDETHLGSAYLMSVLEGDMIELIEVEITELKPQHDIEQKGITFEVTDKSFLEKTGGIIQGMSGSPIIQDDKIIGAVSHVNAKNQKIGYGVYIEWMLQISQDME